MGNLWSWLTATKDQDGADYWIAPDSDNNSAPNTGLITSAVEILAQQRLLEQLYFPTDSLPSGYYRGDEIEDATGTEWTRAADSSRTEIAHSLPNDPSPARVSYFATIRDIFLDLLRRNELRLSFPRISNLNMLEQASSSESSTDEYDEDPGSSSYLRSPRSSTKKELANQPARTITPAVDGKLKESYTALVDEVCRRGGRRGTQELPSNNEQLSSTHDYESKCWTNQGPMLSMLRGREQGTVRGSGLTCGQRTSLNNCYLPNQKRLVDYVRAKTFCVGFFSGGLLTATQDHKIRLYRPRGTRRRYMIERVIDVPFVGWSVLDFAITPDGRSIAYSTWDDTIYKCALPHEGRTLEWIPLRIDTETNRFGIFSIRFNSSGDEIVAGASDGHLYVYDLERGQTVLDVRAHDDDTNAVCFADRSSHIILSGSDDGLCKAWDRRTMGDFSTATPVGVFAGHKDGITFIDSRGDDRYLLTNSKDQTIKVWDLRHFASKKAIVNSKKAAAAQHWDYRMQAYPEGFPSGCLEGDCSVATIRGHSVLQTLIRARFSPDHTGKRFIYSGCATGKCVVYDLLNPAEKRVYKAHSATVRDCVWHPEENEIVTSSRDPRHRESVLIKWDGKTCVWRFDQRSEHKFNTDGLTDEEESCDEKYEPIQRRVLRRRRKRLE